MSIGSCKITIGELRQRAFDKDPGKVQELEDLWEASTFTNKDLVFGL